MEIPSAVVNQNRNTYDIEENYTQSYFCGSPFNATIVNPLMNHYTQTYASRRVTCGSLFISVD